jgi:hypothetical protein
MCDMLNAENNRPCPMSIRETITKYLASGAKFKKISFLNIAMSGLQVDMEPCTERWRPKPIMNLLGGKSDPVAGGGDLLSSGASSANSMLFYVDKETGEIVDVGNADNYDNSHMLGVDGTTTSPSSDDGKEMFVLSVAPITKKDRERKKEMEMVNEARQEGMMYTGHNSNSPFDRNASNAQNSLSSGESVGKAGSRASNFVRRDGTVRGELNARDIKRQFGSNRVSSNVSSNPNIILGDKS